MRQHKDFKELLHFGSKHCKMYMCVLWILHPLDQCPTSIHDQCFLPLLKGADVVLDFVGGSYFDNHTKCMAVDGRLVLLGLVSMRSCSCYMWHPVVCVLSLHVHACYC